MGSTTETPKTVEWNGTPVPVYPMETIDFGLLLSQEPAEVERLVRCCENDGFFYLDLQGIDGRRILEDRQATLDLMYRFFDAPQEAKNEFGLISPHLG
jgi:isopenicillin N synthase-like dioxygenase